MAEQIQIFVLDSFALFAHFQAEPAGPVVQKLLESARDEQAILTLSAINLGEIYYIVCREKGEERAQEILKDLRDLPIQLYAATEERILAAARIKAKFPVSYADAFAVALAQELNATLVSGDPEFHTVESITQILWLPQREA